MNEPSRDAVQTLPVLGQSPAPIEPGEGPFHHPSFGWNHKTLRCVRLFDDLHIYLRHDALHRPAELRTLAAAVGVELPQERISAEQRRHEHRAAVAVLDIGRMDYGMQDQSLGIDQDMALLAFGFLTRVVAVRVRRAPRFSALLTLWLSITDAVGLASRPSISRHLA